jgi:hypothetical protein
MGMDGDGLKPKTKVGEYFRNNHSCWHLLWEYVTHNCGDILTPEQAGEGHWNDGVKIHAWQAELIAGRLFRLIKSGEPKDIENEAKAIYQNFPEKQCEVCEGTGLMGEALITCWGCAGKGIRREVSDDWHPFSEENVKEFAEFCTQSGGFHIW